MAEKNNAVCSICGKPYYLCLSCKDAIKLSPWKIHTDTSEHYKIFQIIKGYSTKVYTKDEARDRLKNVDLSDLNTFRPHIKSIIEDISKEQKKELVVEPVVVAETIEVKEEVNVSQRRNYKKVRTDKKIDDVNVVEENVDEIK